MSGWPPPTDPQRAAAALRASQRRPLLRPSLFAFTFATGVIDAVSYLGIGGVFTANQTGNLVLIGFALGGTQGFSVARTILSLLGFAAGAVLAGTIARHWHPQPFIWMQRVTWALLVAFTAVLVLLTQLPAASDDDAPLRLFVVGLLAISMGLLNATVRRLGFRDIPTTVATSTISDLASESRWGGGERGNQRDRALALLLMLGGALTGAVVLHAASTTAAFSVALAAAAAGSLHQRVVSGRYPPQAAREPAP